MLHVDGSGYLRSAISQPTAGVATSAGALRSSVDSMRVAEIESGGAWPLSAQLDDAVVDPAAIDETRRVAVEHVHRRFRRDMDTGPPHQRMIGIANRRRPKAVLTRVGLDAIGRLLRVHIDEPEPHAAIGVQRPGRARSPAPPDWRRAVRAREDEHDRANALLGPQRIDRASVERAAGGCGCG